MRLRSRPAVLSVLTVLAISVGVFVSSGLALQGVTAPTEDLLSDDIDPFDSLKTSGSVKVKDQRGERTYHLNFRATFTLGDDVADQATALHDEQGGLPDVVIEEEVLYPTLAVDQVDFVGPVALPIRSQALVLRVEISGDCLTLGNRGRMSLGEFDPKCVGASLALAGEGFDVSDLLQSVEGRLWRVGRDKATWKASFKAIFEDPGYSFPIASLGEGSRMTLVVGQYGGSTEVSRIIFGG